MQRIDILFLMIAERSLTAGIVIGAVLLVRLLVRGLPRKFAYMLWIVAAFRLITPVSAYAEISIFNLFPVRDFGGALAQTGQGRAVWTENGADRSDSAERFDGADENSAAQGVFQTAADGEINSGIQMQGNLSESNFDGTALPGALLSFGKEALHLDIGTFLADRAGERGIHVIACVWAAGILTLVSYTVAAYVRLRRRIRYSVHLYDNVYACDKIRSPFVSGMCAPKIYLPFRLSDVGQECVIAHERYHIRRRDYLIKGFAYVLAIVYWFHPLVWAAYYLMCVDMEMSCDEKIISGFSLEMRKEYSRLLLAFASNKRQLPASPLAFGEENTRKRIKNILQYKKTARWKLAAGAVLIMFTMAACATDAVPPADAIDLQDITQSSGAKPVEKYDTDVMSGHSGTTESDSPQHQPAQWAENTMFDMELCSLDYADSERIVFHVSFGLFAYDLQEQRIVRSVDLKALNCQAVQTGGACKVEVYQSKDGALRAAIKPYPYSGDESYIYDVEGDELSAYDAALLDNYTLFDGFVSKYDLQEERVLDTWRIAENVLPLGDQSYGALYWGEIELVSMYYKAGEQKYPLFQKEDATLPRLQKQDDSFYESLALESGRDMGQCLLDYSVFYSRHDWAGVCALSTGLEYSDEMQQAFAGRTDILSSGKEVYCSEDEKTYVFSLLRSDDSGAVNETVYLKMQYIEGVGWRAAGLPATESE